MFRPAKCFVVHAVVVVSGLLLAFRCGQFFPKEFDANFDERKLLSVRASLNDPVEQNIHSCKSASALFKEANKEAKSDKVGRHGYHEAYGPFLSPYLCTPDIRILEIGVQSGNSLSLWPSIFPNHQLIAGVVYGAAGSIKMDKFKQKWSERVVLYHGDQSDEVFLKKVENDLEGKKFDIIIDDGSHVPWHQIFTLERIFDTLLKEGGIYIIEDVETSYWDRKGKAPTIYNMYQIRGAGIGTRGSAVQKLKEIPEVLNRRFFNEPTFSILKSKVDHQIASITFSRNCILLVKKVKKRWFDIDKMDYQKSDYRPNDIDPEGKAFKRYRANVDYSVTGTS